MCNQFQLRALCFIFCAVSLIYVQSVSIMCSLFHFCALCFNGLHFMPSKKSIVYKHLTEGLNTFRVVIILSNRN